MAQAAALLHCHCLPLLPLLLLLPPPAALAHLRARAPIVPSFIASFSACPPASFAGGWHQERPGAAAGCRLLATALPHPHSIHHRRHAAPGKQPAGCEQAALPPRQGICAPGASVLLPPPLLRSLAVPCITPPRELDRRPPLLCCLPLLQYGAAVAVLRYAQQRGVPLERSLWQR